MKKKRIILMVGLAILVAIVALLWPVKKLSLEFVGYKKNTTNGSWYAEFDFVNNTSEPIVYFDLGFHYQIKQTNAWHTIVLSEGEGAYRGSSHEKRRLEPLQRTKCRATIDFLEEKVRSHLINTARG